MADSALYTKETLQTIPDKMRWITRVPETVKQAKDLAQSIETTQDGDNGYFFKEVRVTHCDVEQHWLIVFSEKAYKR